MAVSTGKKVVTGWEGFTPGLWQKEINVRDFIQQNYKPYEGDESFLAPATERTTKDQAFLKSSRQHRRITR